LHQQPRERKELKVLYTVAKTCDQHELVDVLNQQKDWKVTKTDSKGQLLTCCSTGFYDVIVIDTTIPDTPWLEVIKIIRERQILTPILVLADRNLPNARVTGLAEGADMCVVEPIDWTEMMLRIRVLKRRNTNYQSPTISYEGLNLNRPDGKICYETTSLSVSPIEIELFRLLVRATAPISITTLSEKIGEPEDKIDFFAHCLQKKIGLLNSTIRLEIKRARCRLVKKN
jgi:two-component system OmpR family response regulator/two-component system response regulator QseB